jgi:hypothetical protein
MIAAAASIGAGLKIGPRQVYLRVVQKRPAL